MKFPQLIKSLVRLGVFPLVLFLVNYWLSNWHLSWYDAAHADTPMHFLGGVSIALSAWYALTLAEKQFRLFTCKSMFLKAFFVVGTVMFVAVCWEFYEFVWDHFFGTRYQPSVADTMKDLFMGMMGATFVCLCYTIKEKVGRKK